MRRSLTFVSALGLMLESLVGCGGAGTVNFYDGDEGSAGRNVSAAGAQSVAGAQSAAGAQGVAGAQSVAGAASAGATTFAGAGAPGSAGASTDEPCSPVVDVTDNGQKMSGEFQTEGPACLLVKDDIAGWGCSNFEGRTVKVNGVEVSCAGLPLPDKLHGGYYFDVSAGAYAYASLYWF